MVLSNGNETMQECKLFVGGLSPSTNELKLKQYYSQWGVITDAVVMKDPHSGRSRGFGFVTFSNPDMLERAQSSKPHEIDGKVVDAKRAVPKGDMVQGDPSATVTKIFVGGLRRNITDDDLTTYFSEFGAVTEAVVMTAKDTGESRGFGFVSFADPLAVEKVVATAPHTVCGFYVDVKKAVPKDEIKVTRPKPQAPPSFSPPTQAERSRRPPVYPQWSETVPVCANYHQPMPPNYPGYQMMNPMQPPMHQHPYSHYWQPPPPPPPPPPPGSFGVYDQQSYAGGPMRSAPYQQHNLTPYGR